MLRWLNIKKLLLLTTPWLFLQPCEATDIVLRTGKRTQEQLPARSAKRASISKPTNGDTIPPSFDKTDSLKAEPSKYLSLLSSLEVIKPLLEEKKELETEFTSLLKQQAKDQIEDIQQHHGTAVNKYPIQLKDAYSLLAYEYYQLAQKQTNSSKKTQYLEQTDIFNKAAEKLGCILPGVIHSLERIEKTGPEENSEKIQSLEGVRYIMNKAKVFPLSYCLYGYFLAYKLYQVGTVESITKAQKILADTIKTLREHATANQEASAKPDSSALESSEITAAGNYLSEWINRCSALKDRVDLEVEVDVDAEFWRWYEENSTEDDPFPKDPLSLKYIARTLNQHSFTELFTSIKKIKEQYLYLTSRPKTEKLYKLYQEAYISLSQKDPASAESFLMASIMLGNYYLEGTLGAHLFRNDHYEQSIGLLKNGVNSENIAAHRPLAQAYREGKGVEKNLQTSLNILKDGRRIIKEELEYITHHEPEKLEEIHNQLDPIDGLIMDDIVNYHLPVIVKDFQPYREVKKGKEDLWKSLHTLVAERIFIQEIFDHVSQNRSAELNEVRAQLEPIDKLIMDDLVEAFLALPQANRGNMKSEKDLSESLYILKYGRKFIKEELGYIEAHKPEKSTKAREGLDFIDEQIIENVKAHLALAEKYRLSTEGDMELNLNESLDLLKKSKIIVSEISKYLAKYDPEKLEQAHQQLDSINESIQKQMKEVENGKNKLTLEHDQAVRLEIISRRGR